MDLFIGRQEELKKLNDLIRLNHPSLVVIKGRRRIGKSRLAEEFGKGKIFMPFSGITPQPPISIQDQKDTFAKQLANNLKKPFQKYEDWTDMLEELSNNITDKPTVVLFDEISWMGSKDPTFVPKLKVWWDLHLQNKKHLVLIFCGSISTWIEENIINSTSFFGRISLFITLQELSIKDSYAYLKAIGFKQSVFDVYKILSVIGGVPWYLKQIYSHQTADENIKRLCFESDGLLVNEFDRIFYDLFLGRGEIYEKIIHVLGGGMKDLNAIRHSLNYPHGGKLSQYIQSLIVSGYVTKHNLWSIKEKKTTKSSLYRLSDNYLRFYIKYIEPNKINLPITKPLGYDVIMGLQIENLLLNSRPTLLQHMGIEREDIIADNPYIQKTTKRSKGCQIDYLVQTRTNNLFICEFKVRRGEIGSYVIDEVQDKIDRLIVPRGFGVCAVLFYLGEVAPSVYDKNYFYRIIDMAGFLS